jgi:hypothetical protein
MKKTNYDKQMRKVDVIYSTKAFRKFEDKLLTRGRGDAMWQSFERQQQETLGFANVGGGITIPAAVTWLSQAFDNLATYPAGVGGVPVAGSFVQLNGVVYAIPGAVASTPGTPPPGGVWVIQAPGPGMNAWQVNPNARLSGFANPTLSFPQPPVFTDVADSAWAPPDAQPTGVTNTQWYIPAPGIGFMITTAGLTPASLQYNLAGTWTTAVALTASVINYIPVMLDGLTWRLIAGSARTPNVIFRSRQTIQS